LTVGLLVCLLLAGAFGLLAHRVMIDPSLSDLDTRLGLSLRQHRESNPAVRDAFLAVTQLGSLGALLTIGVLVALSLLARRRRLAALVWVLALVGAALLNSGLKEAFGRPRPPFHDPAVVETNESFPSGHAMGSVIAYGLLVYLLLPSLRRRRGRAALVAGTAVLALAVGFSRLYLGVHYGSDVVGGFAMGGAGLAACVSGLEVVRRRARPRRQAERRTTPGAA
jgi:undecaprenyl-diphosphatase